MANLNETATWEPGIFQIETTTPALGGPEGPVNTAPRQLANRTRYLKQQREALVALTRASWQWKKRQLWAISTLAVRAVPQLPTVLATRITASMSRRMNRQMAIWETSM